MAQIVCNSLDGGGARKAEKKMTCTSEAIATYLHELFFFFFFFFRFSSSNREVFGFGFLKMMDRVEQQ